MINEIGRRVMQGGSRRSAIYASLNWKHQDIPEFLKIKNWHDMPVAGTDVTMWDLKNADWNFPAPLDMTNISVNYDTEWLLNLYKSGDTGETFKENVKQALSTGEPGFSFNFFDKERETLRNACTEVTSADDSDVCNLGSVNLSRIDGIDEFRDVCELATIFLLCGTLRAHLPYEKVHKVREKNRRLGLGLMGIHEWLIQRGYKYEVVPELHNWLRVYKGVSDDTSRKWADALNISRPVANRSIAPTGTIGMVAGTTTGIEPVYAVAYKRRYLKNKKWHYQYAIDTAAQTVIDQTGCNPEAVESAIDLSRDYERRIKFQADVQDYVDMAISSTINLPPRELQEFTSEDFTRTLAKYAPRLRGFTCYPDGSRGGQPLTSVPYEEAREQLGKEYEESMVWNDVCDITGGGHCGI
jgi:ribonucleoside-diphosphate reductase alpha chain